jgi:hypothetical protein
MQGTTMTLTLAHPALHPVNALPKGQLLAFSGRRGARIESRRGAIWITQDGGTSDVVLDAGQSHVLERDAPVLIQALDPACVEVQAPSGPDAAGWQRLWQRVSATVRSVRLQNAAG